MLLVFCLSFTGLCSIFFACKRSAKGKSQHQRELHSPTENTAAALPEMPGLESGLYFCNLCVSLCNTCYIDTYFYVFIIKYVHSGQSADIQLLLV